MLDGMPTSAAFSFGKSENYLSVLWVDFFAGSHTVSLMQAMKDTDRIVKPSHRFAEIKVSDIRQINHPKLTSVDVEHFPLDNSESHSGIVPFPFERVLETLLVELVVAMHEPPNN